MKEIPLTQGKVAIVDDEDYDFLMQWKWSLTSTGYARRNKWSKTKQECILMHREIANTPKGMATDHINGNILDNRKVNLRICTDSQNHMNQKKVLLRKNGKNKSSIYKGVGWHKWTCTWRAYITIKRKQIGLGHFECQVLAAKAYNEAAIKYHGEFAKLNEIAS